MGGAVGGEIRRAEMPVQTGRAERHQYTQQCQYGAATARGRGRRGWQGVEHGAFQFGAQRRGNGWVNVAGLQFHLEFAQAA